MQGKKKPAHLNRYANLNRKKKVTKQRRKTRGSKNLWERFLALSWKKKALLLATPLVLFLIITPIVTYLIYAGDISSKERLMNTNNTGIVMTDINDKVFYSVGRAEHRDLVPLDEISDNMKDALLASEDKDFYKHGGFNIGSIFRAVLTNVSAGNLTAYGGSTLTQQLAKNTLLSDNKTFLRKYQELAVAIAIEQKYSKDEILEMYLNSAYFGENAFGIQDAAEVYFGKKPKDLTLAESSMLVGVLPAPSAYSPISGSKEYAKERQTTVLTRMVNNGYITEQEKTAALKKKLTYASTAESQTSKAPHFAQMVIDELNDKYGEEKVMRAGYQVKTTLDLSVQDTLQKNLDANMPHIEANGGSNAGGVVIDPENGQVRALIGSADWNNPDWGKVNMALAERQPGSSFKPIYYSYALSQGVITPSTILHDERTDFGGGYVPLNADKRFRGDVSVRSAINQSLNIPSVEVMQKYGISKSVDAANNLGLTTISKDKNYGLSLALGSAEVRLLDITNAYAAFANQGEQYNPTLFTDIRDKFDKEIFRNKSSSKQAISKQGAYLISDILSDNQAKAPIFGSSLTVFGHTVAVKTGTTNDNRDAWTVGYNPDYAIGVWVGNNDNQAMYSGGSDMAGPIWRGTMTELLANQPDKKFDKPDGIVTRLTCTNGGLASEPGVGTYNEVYMAGALPTESCMPKPITITVCNLKTNKIESINKNDYDDKTYSKNKDDCSKQIEVCDLESGEVVTIDEKDYDPDAYSKDTENCTAADNGDGGNTNGDGTGDTTTTP